MELQEYITESLCSVMKGVEEADKKLREGELGKIWRGNFSTLGANLINVGIAKVEDPNNKGASLPVLVFQFDVNVIVEDKKKAGSSAEIGVGAKVLSIFSFTGKVKGESEKALLEKSAQNLKFSVPVAMHT